MKTIFDAATADELTGRLALLRPDAKALWGKMSAYQMLKHCALSEEMFQGRKSYKRLFIGRLFGNMALTGILKDDAQMKKSQPTHQQMKIGGTGDFEVARRAWVSLLQGYRQPYGLELVHPFFGRMNGDQVGKYVYKHTDHHLRQFGV